MDEPNNTQSNGDNNPSNENQAQASPSASIGGTTAPASVNEAPVTGQPQDAPSPSTGTQPVSINKVAGKKTGKILLIVVIALFLAGLAIFLFSKNNNSTPSQTVKTNTTATTSVTPATSTDVSKAISDVDNTVKTSDKTQDTSSTDLSKTSLGL